MSKGINYSPLTRKNREVTDFEPEVISPRKMGMEYELGGNYDDGRFDEGFDEWRAREVNRVGLPAQMKAERQVEQWKEYDRHPSIVNDDLEGRHVSYSPHVAEAYKRQGRVTNRRTSVTVNGFKKD